MSAYLQFNRPMKISTPLGPEMLLVEGVSGHEAVSELFEFHVDLVALKDLVIPFEKLLSQPVAIELSLPGQRGTRYFHGIVANLAERDTDETFQHFEALVVPKFWLWTRRSRSRIFQQKSVPEILAQVLEGLEVRQDLSGTYPQRDYTVQYRETDFAFASRLMEEEGIFYYFVHSADKHEMVLTDNVLHLPDVAELPVATYRQLDSSPLRAMQVTAWRKSQWVATVKHTLWDYTFELPGQNLEAMELVSASVKAGTVDHKPDVGGPELEAYDYPGGYAKRFDGVAPDGSDRASDLPMVFEENRRTARLRAEAAAAASLTVTGQSNSANFTAGGKFTLVRHPNADGDYYLTRVEHEARCNPDYRSGQDDSALDYKNRFTCLPAELVYRPQRTTPKPTIPGPQTAMVVGAAGQQICVDKYGRIKVQFHWDRQGKNDMDSSCWVRVSQVWAGPRWGAFFWPRVGHEVVVAFEEGDPDQPMVVGSVYNGKNMPPYSLPSGAAAGGFKSCSVGGDPSEHYNLMVFHDTSDDEHIQMHSEKYETFTTESVRFHRTPAGKIEVRGHLPGSGIGGGEADEIEGEADREQSSRIGAIPPGLETTVLSTQNSGAGGGMLEWVNGACAIYDKIAGSDFQPLPGSQAYTVGTALSSVFCGDSVAEVMAGALIQFVVDPVALLETFDSHLLDWGMAVLSGIGGVDYTTIGPQSTLIYGGPNLQVSRGQDISYHTDSFWHPGTVLGVVVEAGNMIAALAAATCNVLAQHYGKPETVHGKNVMEYPEWATFTATALTSRVLALLNQLERKIAAAKTAADLKDLADLHVNDAGKKVASLTDLQKWVVPELEMIMNFAMEAGGLATLAMSDAKKASTDATNAGALSRVLTGNYSIVATNVALAARPNIALPAAAAANTLSLSALGNPNMYQGAMTMTADGSVTVGCLSANLAVREAVDGTGSIAMINPRPGTITIQQGPGPEAVGSPCIELSLVPTPSIKINVGPLAMGASIALSPESMELKWGEVAGIKLDKDGVTLACGLNTLVVGPTGITLQSGGPASSLQLQATQLAVTTTDVGITGTGNYTLTAAGLAETISGTAARTAASSTLV